MEWVVVSAFVAVGVTFAYVIYDLATHQKKGTS